MVLLQGQLVGLYGVDPDVVWVLLIPLAVTEALHQDLDESQAPGRDGGWGMGETSSRRRHNWRSTFRLPGREPLGIHLP